MTAALPGIVQGIADALPGMVGAIVEAGVLLLGALVQNAEAIISAVTDALPGIIQSIADAFPGMVGLIAEAGVTLLGALVQNAEAIISAVAEALPELIVGIVNALTDEENMQQIIEAGITLLGELLADIPAILGALAKGISDLIVGLINCLLGGDNQNSIANGGTELMGHLPDRWGSIDIDVGEIIQKIIASIGSYFSDIWEAGKNLAMGLWEGVKNGFNQGGEYNGQVSWVEGKIDKMVDGVEKRLDIHSPSGVFRDIGENMAKGLQVGWDDTFFGVQRDIESSLDFDSQQLSAGITAAQEDRLNGADGAAYYIDRVEIDASSIREFEDVLTAIDNSRRLKRMVKA